MVVRFFEIEATDDQVVRKPKNILLQIWKHYNLRNNEDLDQLSFKSGKTDNHCFLIVWENGLS